VEIPTTGDEPYSFYGIPTRAADEPSWLSDPWGSAQSNGQCWLKLGLSTEILLNSTCKK